MKTSICLGIHVALCLELTAAPVPREDWPPGEPLAHFRFDGNAKNGGKSEAEFELRNTEFKENALYLNGQYGDFRDRPPGKGSKGFRAFCNTPKMTYESFTVAMRFKAEDFADMKNNLITGGSSYRWFGLERSKDGNLVVTFNNDDFNQEVKGAALDVGKWAVIACSVDVRGRKVLACLNGKKVAAIDLPENFNLIVVNSPAKDTDKQWCFTNYGKGRVLHGLVDELLIYGRSLSAEELGKVPLRP